MHFLQDMVTWREVGHGRDALSCYQPSSDEYVQSTTYSATYTKAMGWLRMDAQRSSTLQYAMFTTVHTISRLFLIFQPQKFQSSKPRARFDCLPIFVNNSKIFCTFATKVLTNWFSNVDLVLYWKKLFCRNHDTVASFVPILWIPVSFIVLTERGFEFWTNLFCILYFW